MAITQGFDPCNLCSTQSRAAKEIMNIFKRLEKTKDLDIVELRKIVDNSLEMSLEKYTLTLQDHRYHQGIVQTLRDLAKLIQTP